MKELKHTVSAAQFLTYNVVNIVHVLEVLLDMSVSNDHITSDRMVTTAEGELEPGSEASYMHSKSSACMVCFEHLCQTKY